MENSKKNGYLYDCLLPWQQSAIHSYERKRNPRCVPNLHCECEELKPEGETNSSFLVLHPKTESTPKELLKYCREPP